MMSNETNKSKTCTSCGATDTSGITDKLKFKNKKGGTIFIHYKTDGDNNKLCRQCWQKNLKQFHSRVEKSLAR